MSNDLDITFQKAFQEISNLKEVLAPDVKLKFYAYNKQANYGSNLTFTETPDIKDAFKINAWMQLKDMSSEEAKKEYIKLANLILNTKK